MLGYVRLHLRVDKLEKGYILGQFYSHAHVNARKTWTHGNQPNVF